MKKGVEEELLGEIREMGVDQLRAHPRNYRKHSREQIKRISQSLERNGQRKAVVVQAGTDLILAGHGVVEAARSLGMETVRVDYWECTDEQALAFMIDDNRLSDIGQDDEAGLEDLLRDLAGTEFQPVGFSQEELDSLLNAVSEEEASGLYPIVAEFNEKYDYVLILATNETEFAWLETVMELRQEQNGPGKAKIVGLSRVVTTERFREIWEKRSGS